MGRGLRGFFFEVSTARKRMKLARGAGTTIPESQLMWVAIDLCRAFEQQGLLNYASSLYDPSFWAT